MTLRHARDHHQTPQAFTAFRIVASYHQPNVSKYASQENGTLNLSWCRMSSRTGPIAASLDHKRASSAPGRLLLYDLATVVWMQHIQDHGILHRISLDLDDICQWLGYPIDPGLRGSSVFTRCFLPWRHTDVSLDVYIYPLVWGFGVSTNAVQF